MNRNRYRSDIEFIGYMKTKFKNIFDIIGDFDHITNYSPNFLGIHDFEYAQDGRLFKYTSHVCYSYHQLSLPKSDRKTTLVLIHDEDQDIYLHELGHVIHERIFNLDNLGFKPLDDYASTNHLETFATTFQSFMSRNITEYKYYHDIDYVKQNDEKAFKFLKKYFKRSL